MGTLWSDLRYAARTLAREPGFSLIAILTLALGIGANTAIFSIVNGILLRPLAYQDPGRLFVIREVVPRLSHLYPSLPANAKHYTEWSKRCGSCEQVAAMLPDEMNLTGAGEPARVRVSRVTANLFPVLGVQPERGRNFLPDEDQPGRDQEVILADSLWRRRFDADPALVGKSITLDGTPYVVIGILPPGFRSPIDLGARTEIFKPMAFSPRELLSTGDFDYTAIARLKSGATPAQALAELNVIEASIASQEEEKQELRAQLLPLQERIVGSVRRGLLVLLGAIVAVLLIVCVNLANLLLARASARLRESAIRSALGAGRRSLIQAMLAESTLLGLAGGALGILFAYYALQLLIRSAPVDLPRLAEVHLDGGVLLFALGLSIATGLLFGILPAWRLTSIDPQDALKSGSHTVTEGAKGLRLRGLLVSAEVGLSVILLITAGLLINSFYRLVNIDKGFAVDHLLTMYIGLPEAKYTTAVQRASFFDQVLAKVKQTPGIAAAGFSTILPLQGEAHVNPILTIGSPQPDLQKAMCNFRFVTPGYFSAFRISLLRGRLFEDADMRRTVAIVSEQTAQRIWPGQDPIGRKFYPGSQQRPAFEVIGVAADVRGISLQRDPGLMIYMPFTMPFRPGGVAFGALIVRTSGDPRAIAPALRSAVWSIDSEVPLPPIRSMEQVLDTSVAQRRFQMSLVFLFAAAALLLASLGIFGVVSYTVSRRTSEIGIRMALGAQSGDVHRLVLWQGLRPVAIGLAAGIAIALALGRSLASLLFEIRPSDPATIAVVATLLVIVAALACYLPARRATKIDPLRALRYE